MPKPVPVPIPCLSARHGTSTDYGNHPLDSGPHPHEGRIESNFCFFILPCFPPGSNVPIGQHAVVPSGENPFDRSSHASKAREDLQELKVCRHCRSNKVHRHPYWTSLISWTLFSSAKVDLFDPATVNQVRKKTWIATSCCDEADQITGFSSRTLSRSSPKKHSHQPLKCAVSG